MEYFNHERLTTQYLEGVRRKNKQTPAEKAMLYELQLANRKFAELPPRQVESHEQVMSRVLGELRETFGK